MNKSIKLLIIIIVVSFCVDKAVYFILNKSSDKVFSGQSIGKLNHFIQLKDSLDLIAFGSSRANHHIDVKKLSQSSFNIGMDGKFIAYSSTLIKLLPKDKSQTVILHIDPKRVFTSNYEGSDIDALMSKYHRNEIIKKEIDKTNRNNPLQSFYWCIDYNGKVLGLFKNLLKPKYEYNTYYGYDPINVTQSQKEIFKKTLLIEDTLQCKENFEINPLVKMYLEDITQFCKENNKKLVTVTSPTYKPKCLDQYSKLKDVLNELGIDYYDYSSYFVNNNSLDYWKDKTHLSKKGADVFSLALGDMLKEGGVIKTLD